jgi:hypothetical protein
MEVSAEMSPTFQVPGTDTRERMATLGSHLPRRLRVPLQLVLTWITGKPHSGQEPVVRLRPLHHLSLTVLTLCLGIGLSLFSVRRGGPFLLLLAVSLVLTVSGERKLFLSIVHATLHGTLVRSERVNWLIAQASTLLLFAPPFDVLYDGHVSKHHGKSFCSLEDPDAQALYAFGIQPGMTRRQLWTHFLATLVSPSFHWQFTWLRIRTNLRPSSPVRLVLVVGILAAVATIVQLEHAWLSFLVAWVLPTFPLFHMSALINFTGEHRWFSEPGPDADRHTWYMERTHGRFVGSRPPTGSLPVLERWLAWPAWWLSLCLWHLPLRLMVIPADMPAHDHHHMNVKGDWSNAIYDRQRALEAGAPYTETWGLFKAIDLFFVELSRVPPLDRPPVTDVSLTILDM